MDFHPMQGEKLIDADPFSVFSPALEGYHPIPLGKEGKILPQAHIFTGMKLGANLSNQDIPGLDLLAGITFYPKALPLTIPSVSRTAAGFFVCHKNPFKSLGFLLF